MDAQDYKANSGIMATEYRTDSLNNPSPDKSHEEAVMPPITHLQIFETLMKKWEPNSNIDIGSVDELTTVNESEQLPTLGPNFLGYGVEQDKWLSRTREPIESEVNDNPVENYQLYELKIYGESPYSSEKDPDSVPIYLSDNVIGIITRMDKIYSMQDYDPLKKDEDRNETSFKFPQPKQYRKAA